MISTLVLLSVVLLICAKSDAMSGKDGRPSFSKFVTLLIPVLFAAGHFMPTVVAVFVVVSAHGTRLLGQFIATKPFAFSEAISSKLSFVRRDPNEGIEATR